MRSEDLLSREEVAVQLVAEVGKLRHTSRGKDGAEGNALSPQLIVQASVP